MLKRVQAGELDADAALKTIAQAKRQVEKVCKLLRRTDSDDERLALSHRYERAMSGPVDLSGGKASAASARKTDDNLS